MMVNYLMSYMESGDPIDPETNQEMIFDYEKIV